MKLFAPIRVGVLAASAVCSSAFAQTVPATQPTTAPVTLAAAPQTIRSATQQPAHSADVKYSTGMLTIAADNSSLNQILREVARVTGLKITGGVTDERVYGSYGPADMPTVLSTLLKGTGSNMMLVLDERAMPKELVLTPRAGGPTPPNPNASRASDEDDLPPQRQERFRREQGGTPPQNPNQPPPPQVPPQFNPPAVPTPPTGDTTQQSPNGVKTPQEIYDQLMKMQQQQKATAPPTPPRQ